MSKALQLLFVAVLWLAGCYATFADECEFTAERSATLTVAGAKRIEITARAGDLTITGQAGAKDVSARGKACASHQNLLDLIQIQVRLVDDVLHVDTLMPDINADDAPKHANATLDLILNLPDNLPVTLLDSSGDTEIRAIAALNATDSSGDLRISQVAGDLEVRDSSGDLRIEKTGGNVKLRDSSGDVWVKDVRGDVLVEADGSGELSLERVGRNVTVDSDGSGDIRIEDVQGDARINSDGSGDIDVHDITGSFTLGGKGSGDVRVAEVKGKVSIPPERQ
jgi:DUF4097 and DUF4098 domain-containing protein YvlB